MSRKRWDEVKGARLAGGAARDGYERARRAFEVGDRVRSLREDRGLSQRELAERIGSTQPAIARLEAGGVSPSLGTLERIAEAFGTALIIDFQQRPQQRSSTRRSVRTPA